MGCFSFCFGSWNHNNAMKKCDGNTPVLQNQSVSPSHEAVKILPGNDLESQKEEEVLKFPLEPIAESLEKSEEGKNGSSRQMVIFKYGVTNRIEDNLVQNVENRRGEGEDGEGLCSVDQNICDKSRDSCSCNDKECVAVAVAAAAALEINVQDGSRFNKEEESLSDSLFSLSIDSRNQVGAPEMGDKEVSSTVVEEPSETEITSNESNRVVVSVLNPVENQAFSRVKVKGKVQRRTSSIKNEEKENVNLEENWIIPFNEEHHIIKQSVEKKLIDNEIAVETSLSSWLLKSNKSSKKIHMYNSLEKEKNYGRQVFGPINPQQPLNESISPRSFPSCNTNDLPCIGTVGSYWQHTGRSDQGIQTRARACFAEECQICLG